MQFRRPPRAPVAIDIAPLVDVVFLLVIFFAVTTTFLETSGLELELPESSATASQAPEQIVVELAGDGTLALGDETVPRAELGERLTALLAERERKVVVLRADGGTRHADVVRLMDVIREAGAETLTVAARPVESGR